MAKNNEMDMKNLEQASGGIFIGAKPDMVIELDENILAMNESDMARARRPLRPGRRIIPSIRRQRPEPLA
ncbi:MAG: hypothetical protein J5777_07525 [Clostridiales bacterium]|nr:hypothetical protein [Clostridiales bacterium]